MFGNYDVLMLLAGRCIVTHLSFRVNLELMNALRHGKPSDKKTSMNTYFTSQKAQKEHKGAEVIGNTVTLV